MTIYLRLIFTLFSLYNSLQILFPFKSSLVTDVNLQRSTVDSPNKSRLLLGFASLKPSQQL